ncbi:ABC transporter ATP-binding protein [Flavobacterium bizetiae]|uniref:Multidrug resistance ABC transporter ATP-binding and permease protein n=2 Tax=Flavobacterium bizetiae TaxID=2704140 RepID=A0A6J4GWX9_9FLAO|nr:ABC transporter ATP-binding protein [Flavobacterium bizetiae]UTN06222.1 ABC transporter ATP-binding protein/permease [Flavobacterium bizetiae]CAA9202021.1 Multidrug resistance ABC transporter ATP-binding and permease protein [Flavobacterium bizetiae]CAD5350034.1 Multidrug resistance ABC transporter ATP-binding and permease protein [Flavobacterium bizetiae]
MKLLYSYIIKHKLLLLFALIMASINICFSLSDSIITGKLMQDCGVGLHKYEGNEIGFIKSLSFWLGLSLGAAMISRITKNFQDYFTNVVIQRTGAQMYTDGIKKSLDLPYAEFEDQRSGETLSKLTKVRSDSEKLITLSISLIFQTIIGFIFVIVYVARIDYRISIIFLITAPIIALISSYLGKKIKIVSRKIVNQTNALAGSTTESLRNIELVKSLGLTYQEEKRLNLNTFKILQLELEKIRFIRSLSFIQGTTVHFLRTCVVFTLYYFLFGNKIIVGDLLTMVFFTFFIFGPLQELGNFIIALNETKVSMENFKTLLSAPKEFRPKNPKHVGAIQSLLFSNVSFQHKTAKFKAVENINFEIKQGETVAFVGPSGSGKTTLVKLLVGLYTPAEGQVLYNEIDSTEIDLLDLRKQLGFVTQDAQLFSGTIRENLLFVRPNATDEDLYDALKRASCEKLLQRAEDGLNTTIGEGGIKVSGGEKQRLSIARAILRNPNLLIFDEATSALDSITEEEINATIRNISDQNRITVLIAHRLSTVMHADKIFVLEQGKIIESGKHDDLIVEKGLYYAMWRQQIGERK